MGNIAASTPLPPLVAPYLRFAWLAFGVVTILGIGIAVWQTLQEKSADLSPPTREKQYRQRMLERMRAIWITGVLKRSLHGAALITLGLNEQQDAIADPWRFAFRQLGQPERHLPPGTRITDVYDSAGEELLILGEPGSGKTTLLLELTRDLLNRASDDEDYPIPVIFHLSSWAVKQSPFTEWLIEELHTKYRVPRSIGQPWVESDQILPLLDGLDEVAEKARAACVDAINNYRKEHGLLPIVLCSRSIEYNDIIKTGHRLQLHSAIAVLPLTEEQIDDYLSSAGGQLAAIRVALREDRVLQELVTTPLMLSVLTLTYRGKSVEDLRMEGSLETRRGEIFATYVQRMLQWRETSTRYSPQQIVHWLTWLARQLIQHNQTALYPDMIQPDWLPQSSTLSWIFKWVFRLSSGLLFALLFVLLSVPLFEALGKLPIGLASALLFGLLFGVLLEPLFNLLYVLNFLLFSKQGSSPFGEQSNLRLRVSGDVLVGRLLSIPLFALLGVLGAVRGGMLLSKLLDNVLLGVLLGFLLALLGVLGGFLLGVLLGKLFGKLLILLVGGLMVTGLFINLLLLAPLGRFLFGILGSGLLVEDISIKWFTKLGGGLFGVLFVGLLFGVGSGLLFGLGSGFLFGVGSGLLFGLILSGLIFLRYYILRFVLWRAGHTPFRYVRFLDYAADRVLLHRIDDGYGYIFIHRLMQDYFASLEPEPTPSQETSQTQETSSAPQ